MVNDHGKANEELVALASKLGIAPPRQPGSRHEADIKKFARLKGADFDREYAEHVVKDHEKAVSLFEKEAKNGVSSELKTYAIKACDSIFCMSHISPDRAASYYEDPEYELDQIVVRRHDRSRQHLSPRYLVNERPWIKHLSRGAQRGEA